MKTRLEKQQFNVRMRPELRQAALKLCDEAQLTRDDLADTVYTTLFGAGDEVIKAKWKKASSGTARA